MALAKESQLKNLLGIAINYNNIAGIYKEQKLFSKAIEFYKKSLETNRLFGSQKGVAICYNDLGDIALKQNDLHLALDYLNSAIQINTSIGDQIYISGNYLSLGKAYLQMGEYKTALKNLNQGLDIALKIGAKQNIQLAYKEISEVYEKTGDNLYSLRYYKMASALNDSLKSEASMRYVERMQIIYETSKKDQEIKLLHLRQTIKDKKQKVTVAILIGGCLFLIVLLTLIYFNYRLKRNANHVLTKYNQDIEEKNRILTNQKEEILTQRDEIEEKSKQINEAFELIKIKNENITDNIRYAVQIQNVMLPEISHLKSLLPNSFIYYEPKDIVSGDFYWLAKKNGQIVLSVADCTGHGVTGAFMSILGITALNEIVVEKGIIHTDEILNLLREKIIWTLQQGGEFSESKEGIHLVVCSIDLLQNRLQFSGAINSIILVRKGELLQYKGDRMPISIYPDMEDFQSTNITLQKDDMIYLFSDGYYGQFGGNEDKKFGLVRFRTMLQRISNLPVEEQFKIIDCSFNSWKGSLEQIDDILVMGIRI
jgi:serine phosphatase RsbU (regulator of sigma subunit)